MKISIITPTLNDARYLRGTIESVLSQTAKDVEHIVVDGGSTDETMDILQSYPHLIWVSEPDEGMYDAVNKGIKMASGDVVAYLNADDRYYDQTLQTVADTFAQNPGLDFVYGYCTYIDEEERQLCVLRPLPFKWTKYNRRIRWPQPAWFWRVRVHDQIGWFDDSLKCAADADFMMRQISAGLQGTLIRAPLAKFMLRVGAASVRWRGTLHAEAKVVRERYNDRRWSAPRLMAELLFAAQNLPTYPHRLAYRRFGKT